MTMPASQPVDYVAWMRDIAREFWQKDKDIANSLATQLTALREAVKVINDKGRGIGDRYNATQRLKTTVTALTHTTPDEGWSFDPKDQGEQVWDDTHTTQGGKE